MIAIDLKKYAVKPILVALATFLSFCFLGAILYDTFSWINLGSQFSYTTLLDGYSLIYRNCSVALCQYGDCSSCPQHIAWLIHPNRIVGLSELFFFISKMPLWLGALLLGAPFYRIADKLRIPI